MWWIIGGIILIIVIIAVVKTKGAILGNLFEIIGDILD